MIMEADEPQLLYLKELLEVFAASIGLRVNYNKSQMIPINLSDSKAESLASAVRCNAIYKLGIANGYNQTNN